MVVFVTPRTLRRALFAWSFGGLTVGFLGTHFYRTYQKKLEDRKKTRSL